MKTLDKIEQVTKIALSAAIVGTACKIALERHRSHMTFRRKIATTLSEIGAYALGSETDEMARFLMNLIKRP